MTDNNSSKKQKGSKIDLILIIGIPVVCLLLITMFPRARYPWNIILLVGIALLILYQVLLVKKADDKHKRIEKSNTILEWTEPRKAWHITEARWFSPIALISLFAIGFVLIFSGIAAAMKFHPPVNPGKNTLTFTQLPAFSAVVSACCVAIYASSWWWVRLKVKLTAYGIKRDQKNFWKYERVQNYHFETYHSESDVFTFVVLCNHKGKIWKIALDESVDKAKIEEILNEHGIPKLEQAT